MRNPIRVTVALDDEAYQTLESLKEELKASQSEIVRNALNFYYNLLDLQKYGLQKVMAYVEMLAEGEHVILDIDHWIAFLRFIESQPENESFWEIHREIARAHAEEFSEMKVDEILERLEACNLFRISERRGEFTLVLRDEVTKRFIREFLQEVFNALNIEMEIKEDLMKIRLKPKF